VNRQEKLEVINTLEKRFSSSKAAFVISFKGMNVAQMEKLRKEVRNEGGCVQVAKARLTKKAFQKITLTDSVVDTNIFFKDQVGFIFVETDGSRLAKTLYDLSQKDRFLKIVGCVMDNYAYDNARFVQIAQLPSREIIMGQLCGVLKAPIRNCVGVLNMVLLRLLLVLQQVANNK